MYAFSMLHTHTSVIIVCIYICAFLWELCIHLNLAPNKQCVCVCVCAAVEFMDEASMKLVEKNLSLHNPLSPHPFYTLVETSGSHDQHDKEVMDN